MFSRYSTSELANFFVRWYRLMKFIGHWATYAMYYSNCCTELSSRTDTCTTWLCSPLIECSRRATRTVLRRSLEATTTFSSDCESLTSYCSAEEEDCI